VTDMEVSGEGGLTDSDLEDVSGLVMSMLRLLTRLGQLRPFGDAGVGLSEWLALTILSQENEINNKTLGRSLGVSYQRANQIRVSLSRAGLITVERSAEDNRANKIQLNAEGRAKLEALNAQLRQLLGGAFQEKARSVPIAFKHVKTISRLVRVARAEKTKKELPAGYERGRLRAKQP